MGVKQTNRHKHASAEKVKEMTKEAKGTKRDTEFLFDEEEEVIAPRKREKIHYHYWRAQKTQEHGSCCTGIAGQIGAHGR